ncbi:MAG TPA: PQQ-binding-like beta-propeller repeat protein [Verrucomicrobiota bacterium]|nr:PQQ-binding-like beta-propeller repeat protein [Verrucomicrobiota bacterium]OQC63574.1 MAG: outer membrane biogenesis protein BamB [Verrucomicrobia bacterium ADurb.Bin006]HNU99988.1 PQQ-binding-like beta-propeller repeat protein [Verrucomicrobiota bacterium]HOA60448.1 PQQ-binding-like beta-propeller repeat protein [Verrucomicrobiota bacterium]HOF47780.1 PQQ-binding-like beta-propeller repeat protein [Verrucomicrobiota bacterium]
MRTASGGRLPALLAALVGLAVAPGQRASSLDWPNWRGPDANGSTATGKYPTRWDATNVLWKAVLPGKGSSTPIALDRRIYVTAPADGQDTLLAFDLDGTALWQTKLGTESRPKHRTLGSSANASPVTDGKGLFVYYRSGTFAALELDGTVRWILNLVEQFGQDQLFWDQGSSPVITDKEVVMVRMHGGDSWLAGFDKATGELRWRQSRNFETPVENNNAYNTPVPHQHAGKPALLVWGADHLTAHDAANGKTLWSCGGFNPDATGYWPAIATPVIVGDLAVVPVGRDDRNGQSRVHGIKLGGEGDVTATHRLWKRKDLGVFVSSPAVYKDRIYLLRHRGSVVCLDPATGQTVWSDALPEDKSPYYASPTIANGILYAAREDGMVFAVRVEERFELLGANPMGERIVASPVPVANRLLLRGDRHLFCVAGD